MFALTLILILTVTLILTLILALILALIPSSLTVAAGHTHPWGEEGKEEWMRKAKALATTEAFMVMMTHSLTHSLARSLMHSHTHARTSPLTHSLLHPRTPIQ